MPFDLPKPTRAGSMGAIVLICTADCPRKKTGCVKNARETHVVCATHEITRRALLVYFLCHRHTTPYRSPVSRLGGVRVSLLRLLLVKGFVEPFA